MNTKQVKVFLTIIVSVIVIAGAFVTADYFALFGVKKDLKLDFVEARFRTVNKDTGALVFDVGVRCFQKNTMDACTRRESHQLGVVSAHFPVRRVVESTLLFKKTEEVIKAADPTMHLMFMHQNYYNPTKTILLEDIYSGKKTEYTIEMPPRDWSKPDESLEIGHE